MFSEYFYKWSSQKKKKRFIKDQKAGSIRDVVNMYDSSKSTTSKGAQALGKIVLSQIRQK